MLLINAVVFLLGLLLLVVGAEFLVRGASRLALAFGVPPLVVGLTIVAYCTSAPELAVTLSSAANGQATLAVGNVIGSNIFNILFILGVSSLVLPLLVAGQLIRLDVPVMLGASIAMYVMAQDHVISSGEGLALVAAMIVYTAFMVITNLRAQKKNSEAAAAAEGGGLRKRSHVWNIGMLVGGVAVLILGAQWMVDSATVFARAFGVSELVIGLTIVAIGTSLPEVAASVAASMRGQRDIAAGNAIGSNISNILMILGIAAVVAPFGLPVPDSALNFDLPIMIGACIICLPIFLTGRMVDRWEGGALLVIYVMYTIYVYLSATQETTLDLFQAALIFFVIPLTVLALASTATHAAWIRLRRKPSEDV